MKSLHESIREWTRRARGPVLDVHGAKVQLEEVLILGGQYSLDQKRRNVLVLDRRPLHFAYPYGDSRSASPREFRLARELGFATAVTTRKGLIFDAHEDHLTALPRLSLSGDYQKPRYVEVLLSGVPFLLFNGLRRVKTA